MSDVGPEALDLLTVKEVAARLRVSAKTVWRLVAAKEIESVKIGTSRRVAPEAVIAYKERLRSDAQLSSSPSGDAKVAAA
jgi:excisionase family DNA binding protein